MKRILFIIPVIFFFFYSCEWLEENIPDGLTEAQIIEGLKTALNVGSDSASGGLSIQDGYYGNSLVKIPLPEEAIRVQNEINSVLSLAPALSSYLNLDAKFENVIKSVNRAAEQAASEAAPIFKGAITDLSISQGWDILHGVVPGDTKSTGFDSTAATKYLMNKTFPQLTNLYAPKIDNTLDEELGLGFSANEAWLTLRTSYNSAVSTIKGNIITNMALQATGYSLEPIQTESIGEFATQRALDGLFLMVGKEEKKIRRDPLAWAETAVGNILEKVFGSVE